MNFIWKKKIIASTLVEINVLEETSSHLNENAEHTTFKVVSLLKEKYQSNYFQIKQITHTFYNLIINQELLRLNNNNNKNDNFWLNLAKIYASNRSSDDDENAIKFKLDLVQGIKYYDFVSNTKLALNKYMSSNDNKNSSLFSFDDQVNNNILKINARRMSSLKNPFMALITIDYLKRNVKKNPFIYLF